MEQAVEMTGQAPTEQRVEANATLSTEELGAVLRDYMEVTHRLQQTHEALQREVLRLRQEVEHKDRELERRRRLAALGEMAAGVAHEIRNPLGAIRLYCGLLRKCVGSDPAAGELLSKIDQGIGAIDGIVQDALALAPRGGRLEPRDLHEILSAAIELCRPDLQRRDVRIELREPAGQVWVLADAAALRRVFVNLLSNAIQASPPGAVVWLTSEPAGDDEVQISVADEGAGIDPQVIDRVFDPFFTTKENGTGLGLAIAHRLVEAHGGRLSAANRRQKGALFTVVLPTCSPPKQ